MKVLHVVRQYLPSVGGMEEVVRNLAHHQVHDSNYAPRIVTLNRVFRESAHRLSPTELIDGVSVRRLGFAGSERYPLCPQVLRELHSADLIHVHGIDFFFDYLALTHFLHRKPMLASTHGGFFHSNFAPRLKQIYFKGITRLSALAYQRVVCTSQSDGRVFSRVVAPKTICVIENGVDVEKFHDSSSKALLPRMLYFGRWSVNKGILETLDVLAALRSQFPEVPWHLTIAGREYDLNAMRLRTQARLRGVDNALTIVTNPSNQTLRSHMAECSYFICQSHHEGFGIAPIEAMSAGLLPLLSDIPPFRKLVETSQSGLVLTSTSATFQAQQIYQFHQRNAIQFSTNTADKKNPRASACKASGVYAWAGVAQLYTQQYNQILGTS
ncbi:glycosyltransferase family 4 protein [Curvibacter sp. APW13]|uniref:glycosyltransferase family 4 protein n=1 Tax=Curvibacter sp. APW13 TaxID=3077236 RepID=UPI0028DF9C66|nr:glycosyltransferase family 4 protein [Curvibacter sp. APW13]MDT8992593.1 glycosyltransferase family 4 protein [Curvibacter sp. APW13]